MRGTDIETNNFKRVLKLTEVNSKVPREHDIKCFYVT